MMTLTESITRMSVTGSTPPTPSTPVSVDRLPPHDIASEQGVLSCVLMDNDCMAECINKMPHGAFYDIRHAVIYNELVAMYDARQPIDMITLHSRLSSRKSLADAGGLEYLATIPDAAPSSANLPAYIETIQEKAKLRGLLRSCTETADKVYTSTLSPQVLLETHERDVLSLLTSRTSGQVPIKDAVLSALSAIEALHITGGKSGLATGFVDWDRLTTGLHAGELIIIAARPSVGKTSLAMNVVERVAVDDGQPVGVFSMEMSTESLVQRLLCARARVDSQKVREGFLTASDFPKLLAASHALIKAPLFIDETGALSITQLRARALRWKQLHGIKLLVIDYLQLANAGRRINSRQEEVSIISSGVKALAKELGIPIILLSQLNREMEKGQRKPRLSDLRESGSIEQDADTVCMLYRPDDKVETQVNLLIAKQRNGPTGEIHLDFHKEHTRFVTAAKVAPEDVP